MIWSWAAGHDDSEEEEEGNASDCWQLLLVLPCDPCTLSLPLCVSLWMEGLLFSAVDKGGGRRSRSLRGPPRRCTEAPASR